jgi:hypothetical protein
MRHIVPAVLVCGLAMLSCWKVDADLRLSTGKLDFGSTRNEGTFTVTNDSKDNALTSGVTALDYQLKCDRSWVTVTPVSGHLDGEAKGTHTVTIDRSGLPDGENFATITATSNGGSDHITVRVMEGEGSTCTDPLSALALSSPADGAIEISLDANLTWSGGESQCEGRTATYDVYFGTASSPPLRDNVSAKSFDPGSLEPNTTYYWKVRASDGVSTSTSSIRQFKTGAAACNEGPTALQGLSPSDDTRGVPLNQDLSWSGGESQCVGLTATYDVYFGTSSPPPLHHDNGASRQWDPGTLGDQQTYYWKIVAKDANGTQSSGELSFTTVCTDDSGASLTTPCTPSPFDGKDRVNTNATLTWGCGITDCEQEVRFTVYLGTSPDLGESDIVTTTASHSFKPSGLRSATTYYWKVIAHAGITNRPGPVWSFKTR